MTGVLHVNDLRARIVTHYSGSRTVPSPSNHIARFETDPLLAVRDIVSDRTTESVSGGDLGFAQQQVFIASAARTVDSRLEAAVARCGPEAPAFDLAVASQRLAVEEHDVIGTVVRASGFDFSAVVVLVAVHAEICLEYREKQVR